MVSGPVCAVTVADGFTYPPRTPVARAGPQLAASALPLRAGRALKDPPADLHDQRMDLTPDKRPTELALRTRCTADGRTVAGISQCAHGEQDVAVS